MSQPILTTEIDMTTTPAEWASACHLFSDFMDYLENVHSLPMQEYFEEFQRESMRAEMDRQKDPLLDEEGGSE